MKHSLATLALILICVSAGAQNYNYREMLRNQPEKLCGCDYLCPTEAVELTPAPEGYEVFYVSHYGRHGARYAWQSDLYTTIGDALHRADSADNLTATGKAFLAKFDKLYPDLEYNYGTLSRKGWEQQKALGRRMYDNFPQAFPDGADVLAHTSPSGRCIMSMSAFCLGLQSCNPELDIMEELGPRHLPAILPQSSDNPFKVAVEPDSLLVKETWMEYIERITDYRAVLSRLFKDRDKAVDPEKQWNFCYYLNFFWHGMQSLDTDLDFSEIFTPEERIQFFELDCFQFYCYGWPIRKGYQPIVDDIIARADRHIAAGERGADLRFGHDSTILPLMMLLGVNGYDHACTSGDEIPVWCALSDVPMAANLQFAFYRSTKGGDIIFKVLMNGEEAKLPLSTSSWPYYRWSDFKARYTAEN